MKRIILLFVFVVIYKLYSETLFLPFDFLKKSEERVKWDPEEGVYDNSISLSLSSEYGKIYYIINSTFSKSEPIEYKNEILLKGKSLDVVDYKITVVLDRGDGRVEFYSRIYRIDMTKNLKREGKANIDYVKKEFLKNDIKIDATTDFSGDVVYKYTFFSKRYSLNIFKNEIVFPFSVVDNEKDSSEVFLKNEKNKKDIYILASSYEKEGKIFTEIDGYSFYAKKVVPPSFGSLYWGQVYRQGYKIKIKPYSNEHTIYYWFREWKNSDFIVGPPSQINKDFWKQYNEPIELVSTYGKDGIFGIAAFSMDKDGNYSEITGPYYFKTDQTEFNIEQIFENGFKENSSQNIKFFINGVELTNNKSFKGEANLSFSQESSDNNKFYFVFTSRFNDGKSTLLPAIGEYKFKNFNNYPVNLEIFSQNGERLGNFTLYNKDMLLPLSKKYSGNYITVNKDTEFEYFMPLNRVRYEITEDVKKILTVTKDSKEFDGVLKLSTPENSERSFKVKFAAFDDKDNIIAESEDYFFKIDKIAPSLDIEVEGLDLKTVYNDKVELKLIPPEKNGLMYYKFTKDAQWRVYQKPLLIYPPSDSIRELTIYTRFVDESGNIKDRDEPFVIKFDTTALFVDTTKKFSGNGTLDSAFNSLERAVEAAKKRNIRLIYILNEKVVLTSPLEISSDLVIQPYFSDKSVTITFDTKALWRESYFWINVKESGFFELRNINININSGAAFITIDKSKTKVYNCKIVYSGVEDFSLFTNNGGKIGFDNISFTNINVINKITVLRSFIGFTILKNATLDLKASDVFIFDINNNESFFAENFIINCSVLKSLKIAKIDYSDATFKSFVYKQVGTPVETELFTINTTNLFINSSDFSTINNSSFKTVFVDGKNSVVKVKSSLFDLNKTTSFIGFNLENSDFSFEQSMVKTESLLDFSYNFRAIKSKLAINSSIIYNKDAMTVVNFLLENSTFNGANNSIFNYLIKGKAFAYWITDNANVTTVNSLYYFDRFERKNSLFYLNNVDYDSFNPVCLANAVSSFLTIKENLNKKDTDYTIKSFTDKNIFYNFEDDFNLNDKNFFIPLKDSLLLHSGVSEQISPIKIPEKDFFGRNRVIPGVGVDIGAVQVSGN